MLQTTELELEQQAAKTQNSSSSSKSPNPMDQASDNDNDNSSDKGATSSAAMDTAAEDGDRTQFKFVYVKNLKRPYTRAALRKLLEEVHLACLQHAGRQRDTASLLRPCVCVCVCVCHLIFFLARVIAACCSLATLPRAMMSFHQTRSDRSAMQRCVVAAAV